MKKMTMFAAALAAVGLALFTSTGVLAQQAPAAAAQEPDRIALDRAVERHLGALLHRKLADLREERAWALGRR